MKKIKKFQFLLVSIIAVFLFSLSLAISAQEPAQQKNIFAEKQLIHVLGPSPAISPNPDVSAVDSRILESCDVFKDMDTYYWFYHAQSKDKERWPNGYRVCVATAPNILGPWKRYENNPVLDHGKKGEWDSWSVDCVVMLKQGAYNIAQNTETYFMFYAASGPTGRHIGMATADNPLGPWKKYENNPILEDFGYLGAMIRKDGKFYMFVQYPVDGETDQGPYRIATADKPEGPWTKYEGNPVISPGDWGAWDDGGYSEAGPRYHEGVFHLVYGGTKTYKLESLGYAYSYDGINWQKYSANPIVPLGRVPDGSGFAEVHCYVEGAYIYVFHTLRYFTGEGTARGLSSYSPLNEQDYGKEALTDHILYHNKDLYSGHWVTEDLAIQVLTVDENFKIAFPVLYDISLKPGQSSRLAECLPVGLEAASTLSIATECSYAEDAKAGLRLHIRTSNDGVHYDTVDLNAFDIDLQAGETTRQTVDIMTNARFVKVIVENLDNSNNVTSLNVMATVGK
ncbi:hypothetical protein ACFLSP_03710 [Bacteroidota bacterium]